MSATEALLLDLLGDGERFGLELVATSGGRVKRGSVYVTLTRMETKGFVESRQEERAPGAIGTPWWPASRSSRRSSPSASEAVTRCASGEPSSRPCGAIRTPAPERCSRA